MSNYLSQPNIVGRRTVVAAMLAALTVTLVGCGEGEHQVLEAAESALPTDPYGALSELRRRVVRTSSSDQVRFEQRLNDATSTIYYAKDGSQIRIDSRPEDFNRLTFSLTSSRADWLAISFSDGVTHEGGRYIDGTLNTLPGRADVQPVSYHVLLTTNPDQTGVVLWIQGKEVPGASVDTGTGVLTQMLTQAAQIVGIQPGSEVPVLSELRMPAA